MTEKFKCLQCGYCCYDIFAVVPKPGIVKENLIVENLTEKDLMISSEGKDKFCPHLDFDIEKDRFKCKIHHFEWFKKIPCHEYNNHKKGKCMVGKFMIEKNKKIWEEKYKRKFLESRNEI